ncbi:hypothetical protein CF319_g7169 [Tilletia indica]|uniref:Uncharacterized protein n=1 Tax=Tilletia indica TaxID=43049 RepID=A0A177TLU3_9BASI|nr:hypothetical protein CF319_g7169 [Tilletia indica]KAE8230672.1 hypothetical protein CF326_g4328 [Tilletia indica]KAE8260916.1 hypothetical protein A4X13_0g6 [Tilletia indica]
MSSSTSGTSSAPVEAYEPKDALAIGMTGGLQAAATGVLVSAVQNALQTHKAGAMGIFTRTGSTIAIFTAMGGSFAFTEPLVANIRQTDDALNAAAGGCAAGLVMGANARSPQTMVFGCLGLAALMGTFQATGRSLIGPIASQQPINAIPMPAGEAEDAPDGQARTLGRELREARRKNFFKQPRQETETEE